MLYDHEAKPGYSVTVKADDGNGGTDTIAVTVNLNDRNEPPLGVPTPDVTADGSTSLIVTWAAPANAGRPAIASYDVQYRAGTSGDWTDAPPVATATATIGSLQANTLYQVRVRATNHEGAGPYSTTPGSGTTGTSSAPALSSATVVGATLALTYGEPLDTASTPAATDFTVQVAGSPVGLASGTPVTVSGTTVTLTLATAVTEGRDGDRVLHPGEQPDPGRGGQRCGHAHRPGGDQQHRGRERPDIQGQRGEDGGGRGLRVHVGGLPLHRQQYGRCPDKREDRLPAGKGLRHAEPGRHGARLVPTCRRRSP